MFPEHEYKTNSHYPPPSPKKPHSLFHLNERQFGSFRHSARNLRRVFKSLILSYPTCNPQANFIFSTFGKYLELNTVLVGSNMPALGVYIGFSSTGSVFPL